jgi:O-antigen/teichoic acid export membrane protein
VDVLAPKPEFTRAAEAVAPLAFAATAYAAYTVLAIGSGRARRTQGNWIVAGVAALVNVVLNVILIPPYGMIGAAVATVAAYVVLFAGMYVYAQRVYPVAYQRRRVLTAAAAAVALTVVARALDVPLWAALLLVAVYPVALLPLGFYLPAELTRLRRLAPT